jgi:hypothetical protein
MEYQHHSHTHASYWPSYSITFVSCGWRVAWHPFGKSLPDLAPSLSHSNLSQPTPNQSSSFLQHNTPSPHSGSLS